MTEEIKICEYYNSGMCIYVAKKFAIFEPCYFQNASKEILKKYLSECHNKRTIKIIKIRELEKGIKEKTNL